MNVDLKRLVINLNRTVTVQANIALLPNMQLVDKQFFLIAGVTLLLLYLQRSHAGPLDDPKDYELCKKMSRKFLKHILRQLMACNEEMKAKTKSKKEHSDKMSCAVRCILNLEGILDDKGYITDETVIRAIGDRAGKWKKEVKYLIDQCRVKYEHKLDPKDEYCKAYGALGNCVQTAIADACDSPPEL